MSVIRPLKKVCAICGFEHRYNVVMSTNSFGYMDLDTRPAPMQRDTLVYEVEYCSNCGFANFEIDEIPKEGVEAIMRSDRYKALAYNDDLDTDVKKMLLAAIIYEEIDPKTAGMLYLRAAWLSDDNEDYGGTVSYRLAAREQLIKHINRTYDASTATLLVDITRRAELYKEASELARVALSRGVDDLLAKILRFEIGLCAQGDSELYTLGSVLE